MNHFKKILGENVYLSPILEQDIEKYTEWLNDFKVTDGIGESSNLITIDYYKKWFESGKYQYFFSIIKLDEEKLIGYCDLYNIDFKNQVATIGITIGENEERNKGFGTESINLLLDYAFNYLNIRNVMLEVKSFNKNAISCYEKVGFKECGRRHESYYLNGKYFDIIYMEILRKNFNKTYIKNKNI